jgi:hypothetical protein
VTFLAAAAVLILPTGEYRPILIRLKEEPERAIAAWCMDANPHVSAAEFVNVLSGAGLKLSDGEQLIATIDQLEETARALAVELIVRGAFSRTELTDPTRIIAYFARRDWSEIVREWRQGGTRQIRHVVKRFDQPALEPQRSTTSALVTHISITTREISSLKLMIEAALPRRIRKHTANCLALLRLLEREPTVLWSAERIKIAVERERRSCGAKFPTHVAGECLRYLAANGLVAQNGVMYRHKP